MIGSGKKKLIISLSVVLVLIMAGLTVFYYVNHLMTTPISVENIEIDSQAALKLNILEQVSKKNGVTEWKLKASSATLLKKEDKAVLEDVNLEFYTKDKTTVYLTADQGVLDTKTHDLILTQNVIVSHQSYTLRSETLHYDKKAHIIHSDSGILIENSGLTGGTAGGSTLEADAMEARLNQNQIILKGHVKGNFSENFELP